MSLHRLALAAALPIILPACADYDYDPRGVDSDETLLSVSATGEADIRPDEAVFQAGVNNWAGTARAASAATREDIDEIVKALLQLGIEEKDIQTRSVSVQRIDYGDRKGQYQASNMVTVRVRDVEKAGEAVTAVTETGANLMFGPDLRISDPEAAANTAYGNAYAAARARAQAYADAADMDISRVLTIRDGGGSQGSRYIPGAPPPPPPPPPVMPRISGPQPESMQEAVTTTIMPGQTTSLVSVQVDFALVPK